MDNDIKHVHVGQAIDKRRNELGLSKSELGRKIGAAGIILVIAAMVIMVEFLTNYLRRKVLT